MVDGREREEESLVHVWWVKGGRGERGRGREGEREGEREREREKERDRQADREPQCVRLSVCPVKEKVVIILSHMSVCKQPVD